MSYSTDISFVENAMCKNSNSTLPTLRGIPLYHIFLKTYKYQDLNNFPVIMSVIIINLLYYYLYYYCDYHYHHHYHSINDI
jgi:hypothetical protein